MNRKEKKMEKIVDAQMTLNRNFYRDITVEGCVQYSIDNHHGEDADGNRGCSIVVVDDIIDIVGYTESNRDVALSPLEIEQAREILESRFHSNLGNI
jgi:hypothetical protein